MRIISDDITLNPGIDLQGKKITTATVRSLTRAEFDRQSQIVDPDLYDRRCFADQINSFGDEYDRNRIEAAADLLYQPDEERLLNAMNDLFTSESVTRIPSVVPSTETTFVLGDEVPEWIEGRAVIDTQAGRDEMVALHWNQFAALAWRGYSNDGRGAVLVDLRDTEKTLLYVAIDPEYVRTTSRSAKTDELSAEFDQQLARNIRAYDPRREYLLFILSGEDENLRVRLLQPEYGQLDPPDAYLAERGVEGAGSYLN